MKKHYLFVKYVINSLLIRCIWLRQTFEFIIMKNLLYVMSARKDFLINLKSDLVKHMSIHGEVKIFVCFTCSYGFNRKFWFKKHLASHNLRNLWSLKKKPFKCEMCNKAFSYKKVWIHTIVIKWKKNVTLVKCAGPCIFWYVSFGETF